jgi:hypothetical protein
MRFRVRSTPPRRTSWWGRHPTQPGRSAGLVPGGSASIGDGIKQAMSVLPTGTGHRQACLLLTDGMQNTAPAVASVESLLGDTVVDTIGFGSDQRRAS